MENEPILNINNVFGACSKHLNFPLIGCAICESEKANFNKLLDIEIGKLDERITDGQYVLLQCKMQMAILKKKRKGYERLYIEVKA